MALKRGLLIPGLLVSLMTAIPSPGQNSIGIGCPSEGAAGSAVSCSVGLSLGAGVTVDYLTFGVSVTPNGGAPALTTGQLSFSDSIGDAFKPTGGTNNAISVVWSELSPALSGTVGLGSIGFSLPGAATSGQTYSVAITGASASLGATLVSLSVGSASTVTIPALPSQTIAFGALGSVTYGVSPFPIGATASSGLAVSFASTTTLVCTVSGSAVTIVAGGSCSITASQAGNASYAAATPVTRSFTVNPAPQTITFGALSDLSSGAAPFTVDATASSGLAVSFASTTTSVCTVSGSTVTIVAGGSCSITASQAGNANYAAATPVTRGFTVNAASQTITFGALSGATYGVSPFTVTATASSGLAVGFASTTALVCTVSGSTVTIVAGGSCAITASQAGNASYAAATPVTQSFTVGAAPQTITFGAPSDVSSGTAPFTVTATASSGLAVSFASTTTSVCTVSGSTVTIVAGGSCSLTASQAGNASYAAATPVTRGFTVNAASQTITFGALSDATYGVSPFTATATASSGLAVSFASTTASVCTVSGNTVTIVAGGSCSITASQAGNASYAVATPVTQSFTVNAASQTITFGALSNVSFGVAPFTIGATASSGLAVSFASTTTSVCTVAGSTVTVLALGSCSIAASQAGNANYAAATPVAQGFTANAASQTITFGALSGMTYGVSPFAVTATASSALAVDFASTTTSVCTVAGNTVTIVAGGSCSITASQAGNATYGAATSVTQSFTVNAATQTITFGALSGVTYGVSPFAVTATASSALAVDFASTTTSVCTVAGSTVAIVAGGSCSITASQTGNANYSAATPVSQGFTVSPGSQTITFGALSGVSFGAPPFAPGATASSGLVVGYASTTPSVCTVSGSVVGVVALGSCSITASQAGNATYAAAAPVTQSFTVSQGSQSIAFGPLSGVGLDVGSFPIAATASSGLAVSFASSTPAVCTVAGNTVAILALGSCSIVASQTGNVNYAAAPPVTRSFTVASASQTIAFAPLSNTIFGASPFLVGATASSGLTVSFTSATPAICTMADNSITIVAAGTCSITASQSGDATYVAAEPVTQSFTVNRGSQTISFSAPGNVSLGAAPFSVGAAASSGFAVSFASTTLEVCTVAGSTVTIVAPGTCSITASQAGNANYSAAAPVTRSFTIGRGLTITTTALPDGVRGVAYGQTLAAANGSGGLTWTLLAGSLPGGISLNNSGMLSGMPTGAGSFPFTANVTDGAGNTTTQALSLQINAPLGVTTAALPNGVWGVAYSQTLTATGGSGAYTWTVSAGSLPAGVTLSGAVLSGTPTAPGAFTFTVRAADNAGDSAIQPLSLQVGAALSVATSGTLPAAVTGQAYTVSFAATGGAGGPCTWSISQGTLPAGLALSTAGVLSGNPSSPGPFNFTVRVDDGVSPPANVASSLSVYGALSITTAFLPNGTANLAYGPAGLTAKGGSGAVAWSSAGLPTGMAISGDGVVSGVPSAAGSSVVVITATDRVSGQTRNASLPLTVDADTAALKIGPSNLALGAGVGSSISGAFTPSGGTPPYTWSIVSGALPAGITLGSDGSIGGRASQAGNSTATVRIGDARGASATAQVVVRILGLASSGLPAGAATVPYAAAFTASGGTPPYVFSATGLPGSFALSGGGALAGTAVSQGVLSFEVQVSDSAGVSTSAAYSLAMRQAPVSIPASALPDGTAGAPYSQTLRGAGGNPPYTWSVLSGAPPMGLSLESSGTVSGNPAGPGMYAFSVLATDASGGVASATAAILIKPTPLRFTTGALASGAIGLEYPRQILGVSGGAPPYTFAISSGGLPPGLTLAAGVVEGTPGSLGNFPITITATDSAGAQVGASLSINVRPATSDLILSSGSLSFSLVTGAAAPPPAQTVGVQSTVASQTLAYTVAVSPTAPWLSVTGGGATPGSLRVAPTSQALTLPAGSSQTLITLTCTSPSCAGKTQSMAVLLNASAPPAALSVANSLLSFTATSKPPQAQTQPLGIQNSGGGSLAVGSITCEAAWCTVGAFPASLAAGPATQVDVSADPTRLDFGFYRTAVDIVTSAGRASVPVTFFVSQAADMTLAPSGAQFNMQAGGAPGNPNGSFRIGAASGAVSWTATVLAGANWLTLNTPAGVASDLQPGTVSFSIQGSAAALAAKAYYATIQVTAAGAVDSPQDFQVVLNVVAAQSAKPTPEPAGLLFLTTVGGSPAPQMVTVYSGSAAPASYQAAAATETGAWLAVAPVGGATSRSSPDSSTVTVSAAGLTPGVYRGGVSYAMSGAGAPTVNVTLIVQPSGGGAAEAAPQASAGCTASALAPAQTGLIDNFSVPAGWPTQLSILLVNDCGAAVSNGEVTAYFTTGDPPLTLRPVNGIAGLYSATWTPRQSAAQVGIVARATAAGFAAASAQIAGSVAPNNVPAVAVDGVMLPFDSLIGGALAPGTVVSIYGSNLAEAPGQASAIPLPTAMNGVSVRIGGIPAPLFYVSAGQINAQIPFELEASKQYQVVVNANGALTAPQTIQLAPATPGLAAFFDGGAIAQHWVDSSLVSAASPARPGEYLVLYLVGMGQTDYPPAAGAASPGNPLARVTSAPVVTLGSSPAPVLFAGLSPGSVGLYQIDIQVPNVPVDGNLMLTVIQGGVVSNVTVLPVRY
jgi:uncharacterized protein (TIGR03437 family)